MLHGAALAGVIAGLMVGTVMATQHETDVMLICKERISRVFFDGWGTIAIPDGVFREDPRGFYISWPAGSIATTRKGPVPFTAACIGTYDPPRISILTLNGSSVQ